MPRLCPGRAAFAVGVGGHLPRYNRCRRGQIAQHRRGSGDGSHPGGRDDNGREHAVVSVRAEREPYSSLELAS
jgi:hypothetical protein